MSPRRLTHSLLPILRLPSGMGIRLPVFDASRYAHDEVGYTRVGITNAGFNVFTLAEVLNTCLIDVQKQRVQAGSPL